MAQIFLHFSELFPQKECCSLRGSNLQPSGYQVSALLTELLRFLYKKAKIWGVIQSKKMQENLCHGLHFVVESYFV